MAYVTIDDPKFWEHCPKDLEHLQEDDRRLAVFLLGERKRDPPTVAVLKMKPGWVVPRHAHDCPRFEMVVQGSLDVGDRVLRPGDVMYSEPNVLYGPNVAGPEGCTTVEFFTSPGGMTRIILGMKDGTATYDVSTRDARLKMKEAHRRLLQEIEETTT